MGILVDLFHKVFPSSHPANQTDPALSQTSAAAGGADSGATAPSIPPVDIEAVLTAMQNKNPQQLNWKTSIVDLMKLVGLDSSLESRRKLAQELHFSGDTSDSASMNIWLHQQVMQKMTANGGKLPSGLST